MEVISEQYPGDSYRQPTALKSVNTKELAEETLSCAPTVAVLTDASSDDASTILDLSEYSPKTWTEIVSYGVPTVGLALFAVTHPILFLAGASISLLGVGGAYAIDASDCPSPWEVPGVEEQEESKPLEELNIASLVETSEEEEEEENETEEEDPSPETFVKPPQLEYAIIANSKFSGLHAIDFFQIFFGDDAPFSFKDFQRQRGDINIEYSPWNESQRSLRFQTPTRTPFFGASHATATKTQKLLTKAKSLVVMECTTRLQDIPFSNFFVVKERWILSSDAEKQCTVNVSSEVEFVQSCAFESQIKAKTTATLKEALSSWRKMAHKAIVVTRNQQRDAELRINDEIEVTYDQNKLSSVVGEEHEDDWEMDPEVVRRQEQKNTPLLGFRRSLTRKLRKRQ